MRLPPHAALLAGLLLAAIPAQAQQEPRGYQGSVGSAWYEMTLDMAGCLAAGSAGLRDASYLVDRIAPGEQTVFGGLNGTVVAVRCIPDRRIAVVFSHSPRNEDLGPVARGIRDRLAGRAPGAAAPPAGGGGTANKF